MSPINFAEELDKVESDKQYPDFAAMMEQSELSVDTPVTDPGPPGMDNLLARFNIAGGDNYQEKLNEFRKAYPKGDLVFKQFEGTDAPVLAFRESHLDQWRKLDADFWGDDRSEVIGDLVDFLGEDLYQIGGELATTIRSKGLSLPGLMARIAGGNVGGSIGGQAIQDFRGTQEQPWGAEMGSQALLDAAMASGTGGASELGIRKARDVLTGRGVFRTTPEGVSAAKAAKALGAPEVPAHLMVAHPWFQRIGQQAQAVNPGIGEYVTKAQDYNRRLLSALRQGKQTGRFRGDLSSLESTFRNQLLRNTEESLGVRPELNIAAIGEDTLQAGIAEYDEMAKGVVSGLYTAARRIEEPVFDLSNLRAKTAKLLQTEKGAQRIGQQTRDTQIVDSSGSPLSVTALEKIGGKQVLQMIDPEVRRVLKEIGETVAMEPRVVGDKVISPTDQLNYWAETVGPYTVPGQDGVTYRTHSVAKQVYGYLREALDDPKNLNSSPEFSAAWKQARASASKRFDTLQKVGIARTTNEPVEYLRQAYGAQAYEKLKYLRHAMPIQRFKELQTGYLRYLMEPSQVNNLSKTLTEMKPEFARLAFSGDQLVVLKNFGRAMDDLNRLNIKGSIEKHTNFRSLIGDLVNNAGSGNIDTLISVIKSKGFDSPIGKNIRAGVLDNLYRASLKKGRIDTVKMNEIVKGWTTSGVTKLVRPSDLKILINLSRLEEVYSKGIDTGTSLVAGQGASTIGSFKPSALQVILKANLWTRMLIGDAGRTLIAGKGKTQWKPQTGIALAASGIQKMLSEDQVAEKDMEDLMGRLQE
jgi:hypothetical protein